MKKLVALLLGTAMVSTSVMGLVACTKKPNTPPEQEHTQHVDADNNGKCDVCGKDMGGGVIGEKVARRADPRAVDAYEAYDYEGNKVGSFKTIADAINATVAADLDFMEGDEPDGSLGGYVTKKGSSRHIFDNKKGFAEGNSDNFWYYENGTELAGYNCWDDNAIMSKLANSKLIVHETTTTGLNSIQTWNGFGLLDEHGREFENLKDNPVPSWELGSAMDASVITFAVRREGVSGLRYKFDLSEVQITPTYDGVEDSVYAFVGVYIWQDYYVVATGIACDTETGDWYEYLGTSRDNSFSDVEYNIGDKIMSSTWTDLGNNDGYWTPNATEMEFEIKTVKKFDEFDDKYYEDDFTIKLDGELAFSKSIGDETINQLFSGTGISADNGFAFTAGLDIRNPIETGVNVKNVDFFNGARFLNLVVTEAAVYFPTVEELNDNEAKVTITPELRGNWYDMLLANDTTSEVAIPLKDENGDPMLDEDGKPVTTLFRVYDHTILQTYACTTYQAKDGVDYYSFRYDASPVSDNEIGGLLKYYQDKIDSLANMTLDNIRDYLDIYNEVTEWYGIDDNHTNTKNMEQHYLLLLDFTNYKKAVEIYKSSIKLSDAAKAIVEELNKFSAFSAYAYKGWTTTEAETAGYLWTEVQMFGEVYARYNALTDEVDKTNILRVCEFGEDEFYNWVDAYESISAYLADETAMSATYTVGKVDMSGTVTYTGEQALIALFTNAFEIKSGAFDPVDTAEKGTLNSDNTGNYYRGFHILFLMQKMEEEGVEVPYIFTDLILEQLASTVRGRSFVNDFNDYLYPVLTLAGQIYARQQAGEFVWLNAEMADVINNAMVGFNFTEGGFVWNCVTNGGDLRDGETNYEIYFGLPNQTNNFRANLKYIFDVVATCDPNAEVSSNGLGFNAPVVPLESDPSDNVSPEAKAVANAFADYLALPKYEYKGWATTEEDFHGYLFSEVKHFAEDVLAAYNALTDAQKEEVDLLVNTDNWAAWVALAADTTLAESYAALNNASLTTFAGPMTTEEATFEGQDILNQIARWAYKIYIGKFVQSEENDGPGTGVMNFDGSTYPSLYLIGFVEYAKTIEGFEIPATIQNVLTAIAYDSFYTGAYYPIYNTIVLAERITNENLTALNQLTKEELAFLNEVWTNPYTLDAHISWNWGVQGRKFMSYYSERTWRIAIIAGTTHEYKHEGPWTDGWAGADGHHATYKFFDIVGAFLTGCGYTVKDNGWGVTDNVIEVPVDQNPIQTAQDVITEFAKLSNVLDLANYKLNGWTTIASDKSGYLYSEVELFGLISSAYDALSAGDQATVDAAVDAENWAAWEALAAEINALVATDAFQNFSLTMMNRDYSGLVTYAGGEAFVEFLTGARLIAAGTSWSYDGWDNDDPNNGGVATMNGDNNWMPSVRVYLLKTEMEAAGFELPEFATTLFASISNSALESDMDYLFTVLKIAKMLEDNADLTLTDEIKAMVNATMVGRTGFTEGSLVWNWNNNKGAGTLLYRSSKFIMAFGLSTDNTIGSYITKVVTFLVANGATATDSNMGITAAL